MSTEHVKILRNARRIIENHDENYICFAIDSVWNKGCPVSKMQIKSWIRAALDDHYALGGWISTTLGETLDYNYETYNKLRATRLAWIDWMIDNHAIFDKV